MSNTITIGGIQFRNYDRFINWLAENVNGSRFEPDVYVWLNDVASDHGTTGTNSYELASYFTSSRRPEVYRYDVEYTDDGRMIFTF